MTYFGVKLVFKRTNDDDDDDEMGMRTYEQSMGPVIMKRSRTHGLRPNPRARD